MYVATYVVPCGPGGRWRTDCGEERECGRSTLLVCSMYYPSHHVVLLRPLPVSLYLRSLLLRPLLSDKYQ